METIFYIKAALLAFQWLAWGIQIGFGYAKEEYERMVKLTEDEKTIEYLNNKIKEANVTKLICSIVIIVLFIIVVAI